MIDKSNKKNESDLGLDVTLKQARMYHHIAHQKPYRKQLQILVVEDQVFSQRLLQQVLTGKERQGLRIPRVEIADGIQNGWKSFLKTAPDIAFVDLCLIDGSGHTLTRAMKLLDPHCWIAIVSANSYPEELAIARQNHVDAFIAKPYNIKLIRGCIDRYMSTFKVQNVSAATNA